MDLRIGETRFVLLRGDITQEETDAVVNAANSSLLGGGGVDGAIHAAGGPGILAECRAIRERIGRLPPGEAVSTTGGGLRAGRVIHTVGPVWQGGTAGEAETLSDCYTNCLALAASEGLKSISFPSISTGAYGYPVADAAAVAVRTVIGFVRDRKGKIEMVRFVLFSQHDLDSYTAAVNDIIP